MNIDAGRASLHQIHLDKEGANLGLWYINGKEKFIHFPSGMILNDATCDNYLREHQYSFKKGDKSLSEGQAKKLEIRRGYRLDGVVEQCGWRMAGAHLTKNDHFILVLKGPSRIKPFEGSWVAINTLLHAAFPDDRERHLFLSWVALAVQGFYGSRPQLPGQILALVGSGCEIIQTLIAGVLGSNVVNPFGYSLEKNQHPVELFEACAWSIDPDSIFQGSKTEKNRFREFVACCQAPELEYRSRLSGSFRMPLFVRGNAAFKWHARCVRPLADYIFEFHEELIVLPCTAGSASDQAFPEEELPAFIWHLLSEYKFLNELRAPRFGLTGYFSNEVKNLCWVGTVEYEICVGLEKIAGNKKEIEEADIPGELEFAGITRTQISRILRVKPLSVIMETLSEKFPHCVVPKPTKNRRVWKLNFKSFDVDEAF